MKTFTKIFSIVLLTTAQLHAILDSNENNMSDVWELHFNDNLLFNESNPQLAAFSDPDGDGINNVTEALAGTDPFAAEGVMGKLKLEINQANSEYGKAVVLKWYALKGKQYHLEYSADCVTWKNFDEPLIGRDANIEIGCAISDNSGSSNPRVFWRCSVKDIDYDEDGLTNHEEYALLTSAFFADSDLDGIADRDEIVAETRPTVPAITNFRQVNNADGTHTYTWNSYAQNGDWFKIQEVQQDGSWKVIYSENYGSQKIPFIPGVNSYSITLNPNTDYLP